MLDDDYVEGGERLAEVAVLVEEAAGELTGYPRAILERVAARLSELSDALAARDVHAVEGLCPEQ